MRLSFYSAIRPSIYPLALCVYYMLVFLCHFVGLEVELETTAIYWAWGGIAFSIVIVMQLVVNSHILQWTFAHDHREYICYKVVDPILD